VAKRSIFLVSHQTGTIFFHAISWSIPKKSKMSETTFELRSFLTTSVAAAAAVAAIEIQRYGPLRQADDKTGLSDDQKVAALPQAWTSPRRRM
jgi:hypothetical protein